MNEWVSTRFVLELMSLPNVVRTQKNQAAQRLLPVLSNMVRQY